ncbi:MAG: hypothetical protein GY953_22725, partial [bacterium]|nr:hypothetical protein [bacterium]
MREVIEELSWEGIRGMASGQQSVVDQGINSPPVARKEVFQVVERETLHALTRPRREGAGGVAFAPGGGFGGGAAEQLAPFGHVSELVNVSSEFRHKQG